MHSQKSFKDLHPLLKTTILSFLAEIPQEPLSHYFMYTSSSTGRRLRPSGCLAFVILVRYGWFSLLFPISLQLGCLLKREVPHHPQKMVFPESSLLFSAEAALWCPGAICRPVPFFAAPSTALCPIRTFVFLCQVDAVMTAKTRLDRRLMESAGHPPHFKVSCAD